MPFSFREVTVSGHRVDTEGTSAGINEIVDVLVNEMGWTMEDDRRAQAGNASVALTHKVVLNSNGGEGSHPNWFLTLTSGTAAGAGADTIGMQIHSSYDVGTNTTAASGVAAPISNAVFTINTDSDGAYRMWVSGDKNGVNIITQRHGGDFAWVTAGRGRHFLDDSLEPFGLYIHASTALVPNLTSARGIANNPPEAFVNANEMEFLVYGVNNLHEPRTNLGNSEAVWSVLPVLFVARDTSPVRKGAIGFTNFFAAVDDVTGVLSTAEYLDPNTGRSYVFFGGTHTLVIRKS